MPMLILRRVLSDRKHLELLQAAEHDRICWFRTPLKLCLAGRVTISQIRAAYDLNSVIMTAARVPQIIQNFRVCPSSQHFCEIGFAA